jgi:hypothetical protein
VTRAAANTASTAAGPEKASATLSRTPVAGAASTVPVRARMDGGTLDGATAGRAPAEALTPEPTGTAAEATTLPVPGIAPGRRRIPASRVVVMMSLPDPG